MLVHTRYVSSNVALLFVGAVLCAVIALEAIMTAGFGADPVHDFKSAAILFDILAAILSIPFFLTMFRWCGIGSVGIWCAAGISLLCCLITTMSALQPS